MDSSIASNNATAAADRVPLKQKLAYGLGGPVDILAIWVFVSMAYPVFMMDLQMSLKSFVRQSTAQHSDYCVMR